MTTIIVTQDDGEIDEFDFDNDRKLIGIGRRPSNEVCIPDRSVSAAHARISVEDGMPWIEDLQSTNGTYVNGQTISRHQLEDGDDITLGKIRLGFVGHGVEARRRRGDDRDADLGATAGTSSAAETDSPESQAAGEQSPERPRLQAVDSLPGRRDERIGAHALDGLDDQLAQQPTHTLDSARPASSSAVIEIKNGAKVGHVLPIDKPVTTLGRPGIQIAAIMRKPDGYFLMHIESDDNVQRPTLNSDSIGDEPVMLHSGDELNVAGIDVEFMLS